MRMWMVDPKIMTTQYLVNEHREIHAFVQMIRSGKSLSGYIKNDLLEPLNLVFRHNDLRNEIRRRGYKHNTDLDISYSDLLYILKHSKLTEEEINHKIDADKAYSLLLSKGGILTKDDVVQQVLNTVKSNLIIQNEYYPSGLYENTISEYYYKNKHNILKELDGRPVLLFFFTDTNNYIVKRKTKEGNTIVLTSSNFEKIINGRTVSISVEQPEFRYWLLDVDCPDGISEIDKKKCVGRLVSFLNNEHKYIERVRVANSSSGYHIYGNMKAPSEWPREIVKFLENKLSIFSNDYHINKKGRSDKINIDLSSMTFRGSHTTIGSLNLNGTICKDITKNWKSFRRGSSSFLLS